MSTSAGTTPLCAHCGRPIIGTPMKMGNAGEPYHLECTLSPYAQPEITTDTRCRVGVYIGADGKPHPIINL